MGWEGGGVWGGVRLGSCQIPEREATLLPRWRPGEGRQSSDLGQVRLWCLWLLVVGVWSSGERGPQAGERRRG